MLVYDSTDGRNGPVLFENTPSTFQYCGQVFFVSLVLDRFLDQIRRASGVVDVDADETFFREIFCHVRAAVIERHAGAEEGVG